MKKLLTTFFAFVLFLFGAQSVMAAVTPVTPSTNDINRTNGWAHVNQTVTAIGSTTLEFVSTRAFASCFEYRTDGDTHQILTQNGGINYNTDITNGLYPYVCVNNSMTTRTITANQYVEVRMVFGAETDERFDWTRFNVLTAPVVPQSKDECKNEGWMTFSSPTFKNQGDCVSYVQSNFNAVGNKTK